MKHFIFYSCILFILIGCNNADKSGIRFSKGSHIILIGNNLGSRMINYGSFETEMHLRYPDSLLYIRNMCDGGDMAGFRPHSGRANPWAFPGAEKYQTELATNSGSEGFFEFPDQWLTRHKADVIIAFFGYNESFAGPAGLENFKAELDSFVRYTLNQKYNGVSAPQLALVTPIAFQDLSAKMDLPDGKKENENLALYSQAIKDIAAKNNVHVVDAFSPTKDWFGNSKDQLTIDGFQLNADGYTKFGKLLADKTFGEHKSVAEDHRALVDAAVRE
ncbi:MAG: dehydrogenase, partial [Chitinophagaceae bacterium]